MADPAECRSLLMPVNEVSENSRRRKSVFSAAAPYLVCSCCGFVSLLVVIVANEIAAPGPAFATSTFVSIFVCTLLFSLCSTTNGVLPAEYSGVVRKLSSVLLASNLDGAICACHSLVATSSLEAGVPSAQLNALRTATSLVAASAVGSFVFASLAPGTMPTVTRLKSLRIASGVVAGVLTLVGQVVVWTLRDPCSLTFGLFSPSEPFVVAVITITSHLFDVRLVQDMALVFYVIFLVIAAPIFNDPLPESSAKFSAEWKTSTCLIMISSVVFIVGAVTEWIRLESLRRSRVALEKSSALSLFVDASKSVKGAVYWFFSVASLVGMVVSVSASSHVGSLSRSVVALETIMGFLVTVFSLLGHLSQSSGCHVIAHVLSVVVAGQLTYPLTLTPRPGFAVSGGVVVVLACCILSPLVHLVGVCPSPPSPATPHSDRLTRVLVAVATLALAGWAWNTALVLPEPYPWPFRLFPSFLQFGVMFAICPCDVDVRRIMYFFAMIFALNGGLWPLNPSAQFSTPAGAAFLCCAGFVAAYSTECPTSRLSTHEVELALAPQESSPLLPSRR